MRTSDRTRLDFERFFQLHTCPRKWYLRQGGVALQFAAAHQCSRMGGYEYKGKPYCSCGKVVS